MSNIGSQLERESMLLLEERIDDNLWKFKTFSNPFISMAKSLTYVGSSAMGNKVARFASLLQSGTGQVVGKSGLA